MEAVKIREWISSNYGFGYGSGRGDGRDYGDGRGDGRGSGYGDGRGYGRGYGDGSGYGDGHGSALGFGSGDGFGSGFGSGCGSGSDSGCGSGYGRGYGDVFKTFCGKDVFYIDNVPTIINRINGNVAYGAIITVDLSVNKCFVVKQDGKFAHGYSLRNAMSALADKLFEDMPTDERIERFWSEFSPGVKYPAKLFYDWHHRLTGSCEMGRRQFAEDRGIDVETAEYTPEEFIALTEHAYNGQIIKQVKEAMPK